MKLNISGNGELPKFTLPVWRAMLLELLQNVVENTPFDLDKKEIQKADIIIGMTEENGNRTVRVMIVNKCEGNIEEIRARVIDRLRKTRGGLALVRNFLESIKLGNELSPRFEPCSDGFFRVELQFNFPKTLTEFLEKYPTYKEG